MDVLIERSVHDHNYVFPTVGLDASITESGKRRFRIVGILILTLEYDEDKSSSTNPMAVYTWQ